MAQQPDQTETGVANMALSHLRQPPIVNIDTDTSKAGRVMRQWFGHLRDGLLRQYPWNFAEEYAEMAAVSEKPLHTFDLYYALPSDPYCLTVRSVPGHPKEAWKVVGKRRIATSITAPLRIVYTARVTDVQNWDPLFVQALAVQLAERAAPELAKDERVSQKIKADLAEALAAAFPADAAEGTPDDFPDGSWVEAYL